MLIRNKKYAGCKVMLATSGINQFLGTSDKKRAAKAIYCESEDSARGIQGTCRKAIQERCF